MNDTDEAALGDFTDDGVDADAPPCSCPEDPSQPSDPSCPYHGDEEPPGPGNDEGAQGGGPHDERAARGSGRRGDPDSPPPMPSAPDHDCDPEALAVDPVHGWVCRACGLILGGMAEQAPTTSRLPATQQDPRDPIGGALRVLDPSQVQGPQEFTEQILYMVERVGAAEFAQRLATHELAEAETAYRRAYDRAVVERRGQGSADVRAAEARVQCDAELTRVERAKAILTAIKGAAHSWRSMISGYQTAAGLVRDAYGNHSGSGRY